MQDDHLLLGRFKFLGRQHETVLDPLELLLVQKTLLLHAGHVENVQFGHHLLHGAHFDGRHAVFVAHLVPDVVGQAQLFGRDQDHLDPRAARQRLDERVSEKPMTLPPSSIMADVKLSRVRVEGS